MVEMTKEEITARAQEITRMIAERLHGFIEETGCVIKGIDVFTDEKPLGQTGMSQIRQRVEAHFSAPADHPAFKG